MRVYNVLINDSAARANPAASPDGETDGADKPSIAVLPFNNLSGDAEQE